MALLFCHLLFTQLYGLSSHTEEFLQIYIILVPFAPNRSESGEIAVILH
jgi:hypothetical protein